MARIYTILSLLLFLLPGAWANNVRVDSLKWVSTSVSGQDILKMTMVVSWENSWRDDFNYDAAYVFFKFKLKEVDAESATEEWHHLYLLDNGHELQGNNAGGYDFWLSPLSVKGQNYNTGMYIYRNSKGGGNNRVKLSVSWNIKQQLGPSLTGNDFMNQQVLVSAHALEMVYVPRGAFRIGDGVSEKTFRRTWFPLEREYDLVSNDYPLQSSSGKPELAADRINDNQNLPTSVWTGEAESWWMIDFGEGNEKAVKWFGVNGFKGNPTYLPETFELRGGSDPTGGGQWTTVWRGPGAGNWIMADDAYPVQKAIEVPSALIKYRCYMVKVIGMKAGVPMASSIAMSDRDLKSLVDQTVLIDAPETLKDTLRYLGAQDGSVWTGKIPATFPNGYRGFYAMKYELSQDQYVRFLNKLNYKQQNAILEGRLPQLKEGNYLFGDPASCTLRNGIVLVTKMDKRPAVFSCNLTPGADMATSNDGQNVACNYMDVADMLAYADWSGLRPLSEMEFEKMARPGYPYIPAKGEYAWNSMDIAKASELGPTKGTPQERPASGNANYGNDLSIEGPIRCGAFAGQDMKGANRKTTGAGYSGVMELSGNLSEMYYNANNTNGINLIKESVSGNNHVTAHGDGYLDANGRYDGFKNASKQWATDPSYIALRGGSFRDKAAQLAVSDRSRHTGALKTLYVRDSTVTFRLGHSVPEQEELLSVLTLENGKTSAVGEATDLLDNSMRSYSIRGNHPGTAGLAYTYIWYMREEGGQWRVLEGENDANFVLKGFASDTRIAQFYYLKRKVITPYSDSQTSTEKQVVLSRKAIVNNGEYRNWADGTYARSGKEYRYPTLPYKYEGAVGSGVYRIDPDGPNGPIAPFNVYCDMETSGGGWMLAGKFSNHDEKTWIATKEAWTSASTFGDATDIRAFKDAKSLVWSVYAADSMMFKTMRVPDKAFKTTSSLGKRPLSTYFTTALSTFPNKQSKTCYTTLNIAFLNGAVYTDFPWISDKDRATAFQINQITIGKSDADATGADSMGVISGYKCGDEEADCGLGISETPAFGTGEFESDLGDNGGCAAKDENNALLFVK